MTLTNFALEKKAVSWMVAAILLFGGLIAFLQLGRLEDPAFTIKQAMIITPYPGASSVEVEEEITLPIETALQQLPYVKHITSTSSAGLSQVMVEMKSIYRKQELAQIWDEMRRKIRDLGAQLPAGAQASVINDDFGDVFGVFMAITGPGYSYEELADYADFLRRELILVKGVGKVSIGGKRQKQIVLEVNRSKLASLNLSLSQLQGLLQNQNKVSNAGHIEIGSEYIRISSTGSYEQINQLKDLMLGQAQGQIIYLSDIADVKIEFADPPDHVYRYNGEQALSLGVSFSAGVNVVEVGAAITKRLNELEYSRPIGVELGEIYNQPSQVDKSVSDFVISLAQAIGIVIVVLLFTMGIRSGLLMSLILLLTICGTFIAMKIAAIDLHRISLGALIIALGMLVDNAIVITDGILIGIKRGLSKIEASKQIVSQTMWPLLGATVIAVTAFAPIGLSSDASGEFTGSLFWILCISLMISWLLAITLTPFFAVKMFADGKGAEEEEGEPEDPYKGIFYQVYKVFLLLALRFRWVTLILVIGGLAGGLYGFNNVSKAFFPPSNLPLITVDYWLPEGSDIGATESNMAALEKEILAHEDVETITTTIGRGAERFMLTYDVEQSYASYGQFIIRVSDFSKLEAVRAWIDKLVLEKSPQAFSKSNRFFVGPATKAKIEARIFGPDTEVLRKLARQVVEIYRAEPMAINVRHDWREKSKVLRPQFAEAEARRLGISKSDIDNALLMNISGQQIATLRNGSSQLPILLRPPLAERSGVEQLSDIQIFSPALSRYVNFEQVVTKVDIGWEDPLIKRRDRKRTIQIWADPPVGDVISAQGLHDLLRPKVDAIELPEGYSLEWGGEYESQQEANSMIFASIPIGVLIMVAITVMLFNSFKQTIVVWLTVPLALIGVAIGLLVMNQPFSFAALLGFLSLSGMILKNGIVLIEEIKRLNEEEGENMHDAIAHAAVSRMRPVTMAAITTVLGLIPLLTDVFFAPLAVTIMFGLGFATILTLVILPVLFAIFYRISYRKGEI
ncbi:MAG: efflux RND transporter permease subunit [Cohaesibacter sp.]|jgi:multidrug efflux pump subunit AcrB|nr:efflux RND transporter permease subunit [Cohaesibacter sp.]